MASGVSVRSGERDGLAFALMTGFVASLYIAPTEWLPMVAKLRLVLLASTVATLCIVLRWLARRREKLDLDGVRGISAVLLGLLALASIRWSVYPEASRFASGEVLKLVVTYLTLVTVVTTPRRLLIVVAAIVLGSLVTSSGVIQWYRGGEGLVEGFRARWLGSYADPNRMAMSLEIVVPLGVAFLMHKGLPRLLRIAGGVAAVLAVVSIVISFSRGGFFGLAVGMATWALLERKRVQLLVVGLVFAAMLAFAPRSYWNRAQTVSSFQQDASAMSRIHAWQVTANISKARPLLGTGAGSFPYAWPLYAPPDAARAYAAHNVFIQMIAEYGFIGFFLLLALVGSASDGVWRATRESETGWLARGLAASLTGYLVCNLFAGFLISPHLWVLLALAAAADRIRRARRAAAQAASPIRQVSEDAMGRWLPAPAPEQR